MSNRMNNKHSNFIVQGGILAIAGILTRLIGLVYRIFLTNIIGDVGNGFYAAAFQIYTIMLLLSSYSLPLAVSKLVSARVAKGQFLNARKIFRGALIFAITSGGIVGLVVFFGADFFSGTLMNERMSAIPLRVLAPTLLVVAVMGVIRGFFQGMGTVMPTALSQLVEQIVNAIMSIVAASYLFQYGLKVAKLLRDDNYAFAYGAAGGTVGTGLGAFAGLLLLGIILLSQWRYFKKQTSRDVSNYEESYSRVFRVLLITILPVILSAVIYQINDPLDQGIFNYIMTKKGMGNLQTAYWGMFSGKYKVLINMPIALANAVAASMLPSLTQSVEMRDFKSAKHKVSIAIRFTMIIAIPCAVGLSVLSKPIMSMLFTGEIDIPANMLRVGSISVVFYILSTLSMGILQGINRMNIPVKNAAISLVIHLVSLYVMMEFFNMQLYAVVISSVIFAFTMCVLNHLSIRKYLRYRQEYRRTFMIPAISAGIMGVVCWLLEMLLEKVFTVVGATCISILVAVIVYFVSLLLLKGIRESEIKSLPGGGLIFAIARLFHLI